MKKKYYRLRIIKLTRSFEELYTTYLTSESKLELKDPNQYPYTSELEEIAEEEFKKETKHEIWPLIGEMECKLYQIANQK